MSLSVTAAAARVRTTEIELPGMEAVLRHLPDEGPRRGTRVVARCAANAWALVFGDAPAAAGAMVDRAVEEATRAREDVGAVMRGLNARLLGERRGGGVRLAFALLELDRCGAWMTIGCGDHPRPLLVRRAGWIDVRGQGGPPLGASADAEFGVDRVGLGPGDALVFASAAVTGLRSPVGEPFDAEGLPEALLASAGVTAGALADRVVAAAAAHAGRDLPDDAALLVVRVPGDAGQDPDARLRAALGGSATDLPGYPVGKPHWTPNHRPAPPREARITLAPEPSSVPSGRRFATRVLHSWRLSELVEAGDVELVTSELLGNAVRHGGEGITVLLRYDDDRLRVAVGDGSRELPQSRRASEEDVGGRGLPIVEALAAAAGVSPTVAGKRVWAEIEVPGA